MRLFAVLLHLIATQVFGLFELVVAERRRILCLNHLVGRFLGGLYVAQLLVV